jgi:hypothetical protein
MNSFLNAYEGRLHYEHNPYSSFSNQAYQQRKGDTYNHWRQLFQGSSMLPIVQNQTASKQEVASDVTFENTNSGRRTRVQPDARIPNRTACELG